MPARPVSSPGEATPPGVAQRAPWSSSVPSSSAVRRVAALGWWVGQRFDHAQLPVAETHVPQRFPLGQQGGQAFVARASVAPARPEHQPVSVGSMRVALQESQSCHIR